MSTELTQERVKELFDYDSVNGWLIRKKDEFGRIVNRPCGHKPNREGYGQVKIDGKVYRAHRVIWLLVYDKWPEFIDHIDRDRMNNKISNLRAATRAENNHNQGMREDNYSGYTGVTFHKRDKKHQAHIVSDNKKIHLGYFNTAEEAFRAYMLAKIELHPTSPIAQEYLKELTLAG